MGVKFIHIGTDDERGAGIPGLLGAHAAEDGAGEEVGPPSAISWLVASR
jgi:hypothetical protein